MELREFISAVITQAVEGVVEAQKRCDMHKASVNPVMRTGASHYGHDQAALNEMDFTVEVIAKDFEGKSGYLIQVFNVGLDKEGGQKRENTITQRISFKVPIAFPAHATTMKAQSQMTYAHNCYWVRTENGFLEGPYDSVEWDRNHTLIRLHFTTTSHHQDGVVYYCFTSDRKESPKVSVPEDFFRDNHVPIDPQGPRGGGVPTGRSS